MQKYSVLLSVPIIVRSNMPDNYPPGFDPRQLDDDEEIPEVEESFEDDDFDDGLEDISNLL